MHTCLQGLALQTGTVKSSVVDVKESCLNNRQLEVLYICNAEKRESASSI
jgi:hypothetical protein